MQNDLDAALRGQRVTKSENAMDCSGMGKQRRRKRETNFDKE